MIRSLVLLLCLMTSTGFAEERLPYTNPLDRLTFHPATTTDTESDIKRLTFFNVYDPLEPLNRIFYRFNYQLDRYVMEPAYSLYKLAMPEFVRNRVADFFQNLNDVTNTLNGVAQLNPVEAMRSAARLFINTTIGVLGLFDPAAKMGLPYRNNDLGMTLAYYGFGAGPYLMLPILGPSNIRDTAGRTGNIMADNEINFLRVPEHFFSDPEIAVLYGLNARAELQFSYEDFRSPFSYDVIRFLYTRKRELELESVY